MIMPLPALVDARVHPGSPVGPLDLAGRRPLLDWVTRAAAACDNIERVLVVTNDKAIAAWCAGRELACHSIADTPAGEHSLAALAIEELPDNTSGFVAALNGTAALLTCSDIAAACDRARERQHTVIGTTPHWGTPQPQVSDWTWTIAGGQAATSTCAAPALAIINVALPTTTVEPMILLGWGGLCIGSNDDLLVADTLLRRRLRGHELAQLPATIDAVIFDFDGVFTDNRVWLTEDGVESAACNRSDGLGLNMLQKRGVPLLVLSKEKVPIVAKRCKKLGLECLHGIDDKLTRLRQWLAERKLRLDNTIYIGNDVNDRECLAAAGCGVSPADGHADILTLVDIVLETRGGHGAVRELCDLVLRKLEE
jgi:YrbI family 3-deoxy-D-manno-octulosonate 8-phosphate phosphatase